MIFSWNGVGINLTLDARSHFKTAGIDRYRSAYILACSPVTAPDSDINQTAGSSGRLSMCENRCMHASTCLLRQGQPRSAGNAVKLGQFIGQFSWVTGDPMGVKGLLACLKHVAYIQSM